MYVLYSLKLFAHIRFGINWPDFMGYYYLFISSAIFICYDIMAEIKSILVFMHSK